MASTLPLQALITPCRSGMPVLEPTFCPPIEAIQVQYTAWRGRPMASLLLRVALIIQCRSGIVLLGTFSTSILVTLMQYGAWRGRPMARASSLQAMMEQYVSGMLPLGAPFLLIKAIRDKTLTVLSIWYIVWRGRPVPRD